MYVIIGTQWPLLSADSERVLKIAMENEDL